jgi:hypothetical protein
MADKNDIHIEASAKTASDEVTKKQEAEAAALRKKMQEADAKADQARKEAQDKAAKAKADAEAARKKAAEEAAAAEAARKKSDKEASAKADALISAGAGLAGELLKDKGGKKNGGGFFKGLIVGIITGGLVVGAIAWNMGQKVFGTVDSVKASADAILDQNLIGYTAADFQDAVLGAASEHQELIVMEQPLEIPTTITKAGLGNLAIFSKVKNVTFYGTGVYTVNMANIDKDHIAVDMDAKTVTVKIPHTVLQYINPDLDKTEFEDTQKGLLAFGDLALTQEQQNQLEKAVRDAMLKRLDSADLYTQADEYATMKTWEIFQPLITAVSPEFKVVMEFDDATASKAEVTASPASN